MCFMRPIYSVEKSLKKLGADIRSARIRRRLKQSLLAERAGISINTLSKVEKGDPGVSMAVVANVLFSLGFGTPFSTLVSQENDRVGLMLDEERLPKRVRDKDSDGGGMS